MNRSDIDYIIEKQAYIREHIGNTDLLIQIGEECAELSQAIFKLIRKINQSNPTPKTVDEINRDIEEELTDVQLCIDVIGGCYLNHSQYGAKLDRWVERIRDNILKKSSCTDCNYHDIFDWRCKNEESEYYDQFTQRDDRCGKWEARDE